MGDIYASASKTIIWLAASDAYSDYAFTYLRFTGSKMGLEESVKLEADECMLQVMQRAYWRHLWVIQELSLSKDIFVMCGRYEVIFKTFSEGVNAAGGHADLRTLLEMPAFAHSDHSPITSQFYNWGRPIPYSEGLTSRFLGWDREFPQSESTEWRKSGQRGDLHDADDIMLDMICRSRNYAYKTPEDRFFALRNISPGCKWLRVDYTRQVGDIFFDVLQHYIYYRRSQDKNTWRTGIGLEFLTFQRVFERMATATTSSGLSTKDIFESLTLDNGPADFCEWLQAFPERLKGRPWPSLGSDICPRDWEGRMTAYEPGTTISDQEYDHDARTKKHKFQEQKVMSALGSDC